MTERNRDHHVHAYRRMLDRLRNAMEHTGLHNALKSVKKQATELDKLTQEEAERIGGFVQRDIEDAARHSAKDGEDLTGWLQMDARLVESWIWDRFSSVADQTRLEWMALEQEAQQQPRQYHTGEIAGPGTLICSNCDEAIQFREPGRIPPCPNCRGSTYLRTSAAEARGDSEP